MTFKIGDKVEFTNSGMPYYGTSGVVIDKMESMGTYIVQTHWGNFSRYDFELKLKEDKNGNKR